MTNFRMKNLSIITILGILLFAISDIYIDKFNYSPDQFKNSESSKKKDLELSDTIIENPIYIEGNATGLGAHNWTWAVSQPWCSGMGTWSNPYIIENLSINGQNSKTCLEITNSTKYFIITNCTLKQNLILMMALKYLTQKMDTS